MQINDKRHFHGSTMPNIFFSLQMAIIFLLLSILSQLSVLFDFGTPALYFSIVIAFALVVYCLVVRRDVINRQTKHCDRFVNK